jgi:acylpyruvate hydrolase
VKIVQLWSDNRYEAVGYLDGESVVDLTAAIRVCIETYDWFHPVPPIGEPSTILGLLELETFDAEWLLEVRDLVERHSLREELADRTEGARVVAPIPRPPRIIALGLNYASHALETGKEPPKEPIFFVKASTSVVGPDDEVVVPGNAGRVDHEVELAVVIGKGGRRISRKKAVEHIAGYTILNDVTARDMQSRDMAASRPWFLSKSFDTFGPMGPCLVLPDEIQEPCELELTLRVNGELRQRGNTRDLIFNVPELIHRLSRHITLEPGDVISTGTPAGITALAPGDVMEAEIEKIGVLRNPVVSGR